MWQPTKPLPGDIKANSQGDIQGNFQALDPIYNGINAVIKLSEQAASPVTAANQMALYTKDVAGVTALFIRPESAGTEIDITTAGKANNGWCRLPCGLLMVWAQTNAVVPGSSSKIHQFSVSTGFPGFSAPAYFVQVTGKEVGSGNNPLFTGTPTATQVTIYNSGTTARSAYVFAIGPA